MILVLEPNRWTTKRVGILGDVGQSDIETREDHMLKEFKDFLMKGNIVDLAVAFVMGLAFGARRRTRSSTTS